MPKVQQISRRTWLARVAWGGFAVWSELNFGSGAGDGVSSSGAASSQARSRTLRA